MTISPAYQTKGVPNPYYVIESTIDKQVLKDLKKEYNVLKSEILRYKCIDKPNNKWKSIYESRGKFIFGVEFYDTKTKKSLETPYYVTLTTKSVKSHFGGASRKDSTASSNVNEFLSLFFLVNKNFKDAKSFMTMVSKSTGGTGVFTGEEQEVTYQELNNLIDADETPERDIEIGYQNSLAVKEDLKKNKKDYKKLYWTPRKKPGGVHKNNPSDVIIQLKNGNYMGYSNKITEGGKDATPKFNTNIFAFFGKMGNTTQQKESVKWMNEAWKIAVNKVPKTLSKKRAANIKIEKEAPSESASKKVFQECATEFKKDKLDFYKDGFYYNYRGALIKKIMNHLKDSKNLAYFLNTVGFYTFGVTIGTPCPYKLLVGRPNAASTIKEITKNEDFRELLENKKASLLKNISPKHTEGTQNFTLDFQFLNFKVHIPITVRTRAAGGWSGKSLYMTSSGIDMIK